MGLTLSRRDFVPFDTVCARKGSDGKTHRIRTGKAYIFLDENGAEHPCGPHCASQWVEDKALISRVPDLTTALSGAEGESSSSSAGSTGGGSKADPRKKAEAYVLLRQTPLIENTNIRHDALNAAYQEMANQGALETNTCDFVLRFMRGAAEKFPKFGYDNLTAVYAIARLTQDAIQAKPDQAEFFQSIRDQAVKYLTLTQKQVDSLNAALVKRFGEEVQIDIGKLQIRTSKTRGG